MSAVKRRAGSGSIKHSIKLAKGIASTLFHLYFSTNTSSIFQIFNSSSGTCFSLPSTKYTFASVPVSVMYLGMPPSTSQIRLRWSMLMEWLDFPFGLKSISPVAISKARHPTDQMSAG